MSDLSRFHSAQEYDYQTALSEIRQGRKQSHWMWYTFPQIAGLGRSSLTQYYAIADLQEAKDYMNDPVLGPRLIEISSALLELDSNNPTEVMGCPDDIKLKSSMPLFLTARPDCTVFAEVLDKYYKGERDKWTLKILGKR